MTRWRRQDGSAPVIELALAAPLIGVLLWLVGWAGTAARTPTGLERAVTDAARHAAIIRQVQQRPTVAEQLVRDRAGDLCDGLAVEYQQDGQVIRVTATCRLATREQDLLGVPARTVTATGRSTVDRWFVEHQP